MNNTAEIARLTAAYNSTAEALNLVHAGKFAEASALIRPMYLDRASYAVEMRRPLGELFLELGWAIYRSADMEELDALFHDLRRHIEGAHFSLLCA